jgi:hypothetical protein
LATAEIVPTISFFYCLNCNDNEQALTMAITDIKDNYEFYKERYEKWLKG